MLRIPLSLAGVIFVAGLSVSSLAQAAKDPVAAESATPPASRSSFVDRAAATAQDAIDQAMDLLGIRYRRGGTSPETGFDCSGFVSHVFREGVGLILPRTSREMSQAGEEVRTEELRPGDLVFFNTMRHAFSHVGIYLGNHQFVHSPRAGGRVRIEDMREAYWKKRFDGARRINPS